jgi:hypothetical protein
MNTRFNVFLLLWFLGLSCSGSESGSVSMWFTWEQEPESEVWIWVRIEERESPTEAGRILASDGPVAWHTGDGLAVTLPEVRNGANRYVVAEVREGANAGLPVLYYGISETFSLVAGKHTRVKVPMLLQVPETQAIEGAVELLFDGLADDEVNPTQIVNATLRTRSVNAHSIVIANDASFSAGVAEVLLSDKQQVTCAVEPIGELSWSICDLTGWNLTADLDVNDQLYTVYVKFIDRYGYESTVHKASVLLDSQGPVALVASVTPEVARPGLEVFINVSFHEPLASQGGGLLTVSPELPEGATVSGPTRVGDSNSYLWKLMFPSGEGMDGNYQLWVDAVDASGNQTLDQPLVDGNQEPTGLYLDATLPHLAGEQPVHLSQALFGPPDVGTLLSFDFGIIESRPPEMGEDDDSGCSGNCPVVRFGNTTVGKVTRMTESDDAVKGLWEFRYEYLVDSDDWGATDQTVDVDISWSDVAGNLLEGGTGASVRFDFVEPVVSCSAFPDPAKAGDQVTMVVKTSEPLALLPVPIAPPLALEASTPFTSGSTAFQYIATIQVMDEEVSSWQITDLTAQDIAGNIFQMHPDHECAIAHEIDATLPIITGAVNGTPEIIDAYGNLRMGHDSTLEATVTISDNLGLADGLTHGYLEISGNPLTMNLDNQTDLGDKSWSFVFSHQFDSLLDTDFEGTWPVRIVTADKAGNSVSDSFLDETWVTVDFSPPLASCFVNVANAKAGFTILLSASLNEPLLKTPTIDSDIAWSLRPDLSDPGGAAPVYVYEHVVEQGDEYREWRAKVQAQDLLGNPSPPSVLCEIEGVLDGKAVGIGDKSVIAAYEASPEVWVESGSVARADAKLEIQFTVDELPAAGTLDVSVGEVEVTTCEFTLLQCSCTHSLGGQGGSGQTLPVTVQLADSVGNLTFATLGTVLLDYNPPKLAGTPNFERCDGFGPARVSQQDIWVQQQPSCAYFFDPALCQLPGESGEYSIRTGFSLSESVVLESSIVYLETGEELTLDTCESTSTYVVALYSPTGDEVQCASDDNAGTQVYALATDAAGNSAELPLGVLRFDFTKPEQPGADKQSQFELFRAPWGAAETAGQSASEVRLCPEGPAQNWAWCGQESTAPFSANSSITIYKANVVDGTAMCTDSVLAQETISDLPGEVRIEVPGDWRAVCLSETDRAGNESTPAVVANVEWIASMGDKIAGESASNPHRFFHSVDLQTNLVQGPYEMHLSQNELQDLVAPDGQTISVSGERVWREVESESTLPEARQKHEIAYDDRRGIVVMFGGQGQTKRYNDTWEWNGRTWLDKTPQKDSPPGRRYHGMAFDSARGRTVLFGGEGAGSKVSYNDTWEWDGTAWKEVGGDSPGPVSRFYNRLCYHPPTGRILLFGGTNHSHFYDPTTWLWDGSGWAAPQLLTPKPKSRAAYSMAYNPHNEKILLFGGRTGTNQICGSNPTNCNDTWEWDGQQWNDVTPDGLSPPVRKFAALTYDPLRKTMILVGGVGESGYIYDVWEWDGSAWSEVISPWTSDLGYFVHLDLIHDPLRKTVIGTAGVETKYPETADKEWVSMLLKWDGQTFTEITPTGLEPGPRNGDRATWNVGGREVLLMGGKKPNDATEATDLMWFWDRFRWTFKQGSEEDLPVLQRGEMGMALVSESNEVLLWGGQTWPGNDQPRDLWSWDGESWSELEQGASQPNCDSGPSLVNCPEVGGVFHFGGYSVNDPASLWLWSGTNWSDFTSESPNPPRQWFQTLACDSTRSALVMFGGGISNVCEPLAGDFWEYSNGAWTAKPTDVAPSRRQNSALCYDPGRARSVLFGGDQYYAPDGCGNQKIADTWEWDGQDWVKASATADMPVPRSRHTLLFDADDQKVYAVGGLTDSDSSALLEWNSSPSLRPAALFSVDFTKSLASLEQVDGWSLKFTGGARGYGLDLDPDDDGDLVGDTIDGLEVMAWNAWLGEWQSLETTDQSPESMLTAEITITGNDLAREYHTGRDGNLTFAFVPAASSGNGPQTARIVSDYVDFRVRYHW